MYRELWGREHGCVGSGVGKVCELPRMGKI